MRSIAPILYPFRQQGIERNRLAAGLDHSCNGRIVSDDRASAHSVDHEIRLKAFALRMQYRVEQADLGPQPGENDAPSTGLSDCFAYLCVFPGVHASAVDFRRIRVFGAESYQALNYIDQQIEVVRKTEPRPGQKFLRLPGTETEAVTAPDGLADDLG